MLWLEAHKSHSKIHASFFRRFRLWIPMPIVWIPLPWMTRSNYVIYTRCGLAQLAYTVDRIQKNAVLSRQLYGTRVETLITCVQNRAQLELNCFPLYNKVSIYDAAVPCRNFIPHTYAVRAKKTRTETGFYTLIKHIARHFIQILIHWVLQMYNVAK